MSERPKRAIATGPASDAVPVPITSADRELRDDQAQAGPPRERIRRTRAGPRPACSRSVRSPSGRPSDHRPVSGGPSAGRPDSGERRGREARPADDAGRDFGFKRGLDSGRGSQSGPERPGREGRTPPWREGSPWVFAPGRPQRDTPWGRSGEAPVPGATEIAQDPRFRANHGRTRHGALLPRLDPSVPRPAATPRSGTTLRGPSRRGSATARTGPIRRPSLGPTVDRLPRPAVADARAARSQDEELVAGRRPVEEAFAAREPAIRLLVVPEPPARARAASSSTPPTLQHPDRRGRGRIADRARPASTATRASPSSCEPRRFATHRRKSSPEPLNAASRPSCSSSNPFEDPQTFGTVLRSAEAAGVHGVLFPTERQAPLSPAAVKASAGATEHLLLCPVTTFRGLDLHVRGIRVVGSERTPR